MKIEIDAQDIVQSRVFKGRDGKPDRTNYWQNGYMYNGGRFPVLIEIPLEEGQPAYVAGDYEIHPCNFQASKYNKMELNPFKLILVPFSKVGADSPVPEVKTSKEESFRPKNT